MLLFVHFVDTTLKSFYECAIRLFVTEKVFLSLIKSRSPRANCHLSRDSSSDSRYRYRESIRAEAQISSALLKKNAILWVPSSTPTSTSRQTLSLSLFLAEQESRPPIIIIRRKRSPRGRETRGGRYLGRARTGPVRAITTSPSLERVLFVDRYAVRADSLPVAARLRDSARTRCATARPRDVPRRPDGPPPTVILKFSRADGDPDRSRRRLWRAPPPPPLPPTTPRRIPLRRGLLFFPLHPRISSSSSRGPVSVPGRVEGGERRLLSKTTRHEIHASDSPWTFGRISRAGRARAGQPPCSPIAVAARRFRRGEGGGGGRRRDVIARSSLRVRSRAGAM